MTFRLRNVMFAPLLARNYVCFLACLLLKCQTFFTLFSYEIFELVLIECWKLSGCIAFKFFVYFSFNEIIGFHIWKSSLSNCWVTWKRKPNLIGCFILTEWYLSKASNILLHLFVKNEKSVTKTATLAIYKFSQKKLKFLRSWIFR